MNLSKRIHWFVLFILSYSYTGFSCSCIGEEDVFTAFKASDAVFTGKLKFKEYVEFLDTIYFVQDGEKVMYVSKTRKMKYVFKIKIAFKGTLENSTITVYTGLGRGDCGYNFEKRKEYIVYTNKQNIGSRTVFEKDVHTTNICTNTKILEQSEVIKLCQIKSETN